MPIIIIIIINEVRREKKHTKWIGSIKCKENHNFGSIKRRCSEFNRISLPYKRIFILLILRYGCRLYMYFMQFSWSAYTNRCQSFYFFFFYFSFHFISLLHVSCVLVLYMSYPLFLLLLDFFRALFYHHLKHLCRLCNRFWVESLNFGCLLLLLLAQWKREFWTSNATTNALYTNYRNACAEFDSFKQNIINFWYGFITTLEFNQPLKPILFLWIEGYNFIKRFFPITAFIFLANNFLFSSFVYGSFSINRLQRFNNEEMFEVEFFVLSILFECYAYLAKHSNTCQFIVWIFVWLQCSWNMTIFENATIFVVVFFPECVCVVDFFEVLYTTCRCNTPCHFSLSFSTATVDKMASQRKTYAWFDALFSFVVASLNVFDLLVVWREKNWNWWCGCNFSMYCLILWRHNCRKMCERYSMAHAKINQKTLWICAVYFSFLFFLIFSFFFP